MGEKELFRHEIPQYVDVHYLLEHPILTTPHKNKKTGNTNFFEKTISELVLPPIQKKVKRRKLEKLLKDVDVVIDFDSTLSPMYRLFHDKRSIVYCHFGFENIWKGKQRKLDKLAVRLSHYNNIVMLCEEMKDDAAAMYPVLAQKLIKIYNAVDIDRIKQLAEEPIELPPAFNQHGYIVSVGRLHEAQKDFTTLIYAYAKAVSNHKIEQRLVIVGKGGSKEELEALTERLGIMDRVLFTGLQANPYKWMARAKLFLFSSKYEGLPTVLIEAHALNMPIIATATPTGVKELLMNGEAGCLVPIGDVDAMSNAIVGLLSDASLQNCYRTNSAKLLSQFDIEFMIPQLETLFD
jgi:glycosyltransferase involved in cell wall biosynthesis